MTTLEKYEFHEYANVFPMLSQDKLLELMDDIIDNGLREKITLFEGKILDGRNRYEACIKGNIEPIFTTFEGTTDQALAHVISLNLHRRHLSDSQRAMIGAKLAKISRGGDRGNQHTGGKVEISTLPQAKAAEMLNVSRDSVIAARKVQTKGTPALVAAVESGKIAVSAAATIAQAPKEEQDEIVVMDKKEIVEAAKEIKAKKPAVRLRPWQKPPKYQPPVKDNGDYVCKEKVTGITVANNDGLWSIHVSATLDEVKEKIKSVGFEITERW